MAEYFAPTQNIPLNQAAIWFASIPCTRGQVIHEDGTGIFTLRGCNTGCFARYEVTMNGNIALPEGGTPGPIAVSLTVNGETRTSSVAIVTPAAVENFFNVTSVATVTVPRGCCFSVSLRHVPASADAATTPAPVITLQNGNLTIKRTA